MILLANHLIVDAERPFLQQHAAGELQLAIRFKQSS